MECWQMAQMMSNATGLDLENVYHEVKRVELKPLKGTFSTPITTPWVPLPEGIGELPLHMRTPLSGGLVVTSAVSLLRDQNQHCDDSSNLLRTVLKYATSGNNDLRRIRRDALRQLGDCECTSELCQIISKYATSGDCDARETRRAALGILKSRKNVTMPAV